MTCVGTNYEMLCMFVAGPSIHRTRNCKRRQSQNVHDVHKMCPICCEQHEPIYAKVRGNHGKKQVMSWYVIMLCPWALSQLYLLYIEGVMHFLPAESAKQRGKMHRTCWTHIQSPELFRWNGDANMLRQHSCGVHATPPYWYKSIKS